MSADFPGDMKLSQKESNDGGVSALTDGDCEEEDR